MSGSSTPCVDENKIGALFDHRLTQSEVDDIDQHVAHCTDCRDLLCSMARLYASSSPSRAILQTAPLAVAASALESGQSDEEASIKRLLALVGCERQVGRVLGGKWRLDAVIGVGGMAEVYAATHASNGRRAAIKLLRREWLSRPNVVYRFLREGYVANRIGHPGAVAILDDGTTDDGLPFLVLELLEGATMASHTRVRLPVATVLWTASEILDVLSAAHEHGIVHRDIKPENVLLTRQGSVKVLDFGIARMRELGMADGAGGGRATQQGMLLGTPAYMPPEQARGRWDEIDARTDIWAVGATMFVLLSGRPVHAGGTSNETLMAAMREPAPKLATVAPAVSPEICAIVDRALAFAREDRWPSARLMQDEIRAELGRMGGAVKRPRRSTASAALLLAVALPLVVTVAFVARARAAPGGEPMRAEPVPTMTTNEATSSPTLLVAPAPKAMSESTSVPASALDPSSTAPRPHADVKGAAPGARPKPIHRPADRRARVAAEPPTVAAPEPAPPPLPLPPREDPLDRRD